LKENLSFFDVIPSRSSQSLPSLSIWWRSPVIWYPSMVEV